MTRHMKVTRLKLDCQKAVEAIDYIASRWAGASVYYVCKIAYFADRNHCIDWGRTITGDRYVAMDHGPVPSRVYEMLKLSSSEEDELLDAMSARVRLEPAGQKTLVYSRGSNQFSSLSQTDCEYLDEAIKFCRQLTFSDLRRITHEELPYKRATAGNPVSNNPPMDLADWFEQEGLDRDRGGKELMESVLYAIG